jgi:hypothetical protein
MTLAALTIFSPLEEDAAHDLQFLARLLAFCGVLSSLRYYSFICGYCREADNGKAMNPNHRVQEARDGMPPNSHHMNTRAADAGQATTELTQNSNGTAGSSLPAMVNIKASYRPTRCS